MDRHEAEELQAARAAAEAAEDARRARRARVRRIAGAVGGGALAVVGHALFSLYLGGWLLGSVALGAGLGWALARFRLDHLAGMAAFGLPLSAYGAISGTATPLTWLGFVIAGGVLSLALELDREARG